MAPSGDGLAIGTLLRQGQFRIEKLLGQGGFGITYLATDLTLHRTVAIKELFLSDWRRDQITVQPPGRLPLADFQELKTKFLQEARTLAQFDDPSIVKVYDQFIENNTAYLVMEYLRGESLLDKIVKEGTVSSSYIIQITRSLSQALRLIHESGKIHRDIKPENIILDVTGRTVLIDFGSVRDFQTSKTISMTRLVTPGYAPLEQYAHKGRLGPATDIYALGATLYHAVTGKMPPPAPDLATGAPLPPLPSSVHKGLAQAINTAMNVSVAQRPQDVDNFLALLDGPVAIASSTPLPNDRERPVLEYIDRQGISLQTLFNNLKDGTTQIGDLSEEVSADLIQMNWINRQGQLTFFGGTPRRQPARPTAKAPAATTSSPTPSPAPQFTPSSLTPAAQKSQKQGSKGQPPPSAFPDPADIQKLWQAIEKLTPPDPLTLPMPSLPPVELSKSQPIKTVALMAVTLIGLWGFLQLNLNLVGISLLTWIIIKIIVRPQQRDPQLLAQLTDVDRRIAEEVRIYQTHNDPASRFEMQLRELKRLRDQILNADQLLAQREQAAQQQYQQHVVEAELKRQSLRSGIVSGIGPQRISALNQHGMYAAFDLDRTRLARISGIGEKITEDLMRWRRKVEQAARAKVPAWTEHATVRSTLAAELWDARKRLADGPQILQNLVEKGRRDHIQAKNTVQNYLQQRKSLIELLQ